MMKKQQEKNVLFGMELFICLLILSVRQRLCDNYMFARFGIPLEI